MGALLDALGGGSRTLAWFGGIGLMGLAAVGVMSADLKRDDSCAASERLDRSWSSKGRSMLEDSLGAEHGAVRIVSNYAHRLDEVLDQGCKVDASAVVLACHDELIVRFDAVVGLLVEGPEGLQPVQVAEGLVDPLYCDGAESRPGSDDEMAELSGLLQRVDALALSGLFDEALEEANVAVRRAQALGRPSVSSEAFYQRGKVYARRGELDPANSDFTAAYELAVMTRAYAGSANIALSLVWVTQHQNDLDGAEHWLRVATSAQEAAGGAGKAKRARILMRGGEVALARRDMPEARALLTQSADVWRELKNAREEATVLASLVSIELEAGEFDVALESARRAIEVFSAENGDDDPQLGTHYMNLGNVLARRGEHEEALQAYEQAVRRRERAYGEDHVAAGEARYGKGTTLVDLGRMEEAKALLERVQRDAPPGHILAVAVDMVLSRVASSDGNHKQALALANKAFVYYEAQFGAEHAQAAPVRINLAQAKLAAGDLAGALEDARAARAVLEGQFGKTHDVAGQCLAVEAEALAKQGTPEKARLLYERALSIAVAAQGESSGRVAGLREALAALGEGD